MIVFRLRLIAVIVAMLAAYTAVCKPLCAQYPNQATMPGQPQNPGQLPPGGVPAAGEMLVQEVRVTGNHTTPVSKLPKLRTRVGQPFDPLVVREDARTLQNSRKFLDAKPLYQAVPGGMLVIFQVVERPMLEEVLTVGNQDIRTQTLRKKSELEAKQPLDPYAVEEAKRRLEAYYRENGYNHPHISIVEGNKSNDRRAVFMIDEGKKQRVQWTGFEGNTFESDSRLRLQVKTKPGILWLFGGKVDQQKIADDTNSLIAYYRSFGYFKAKVSPVMEYNDDKTWLNLKFVIDEGPRYSIRNVSFIGNEKYKNEELNKGLEQIAGKPYSQLALNRDKVAVSDVYGEHGYIFADVQPTPRLDPDKPEVDLVWEITEGKRYRVGLVNINITGDNPHTAHSTILNRMSVHPGDIVNTKKLREDERRLKFASIFNNDPSKGDTPRITFNKSGEEKDEAVARGPGGKGAPSGSGNSGSGYRGQSPDSFRGQSPDEEVTIVPYESKDEAGNTIVVWVPIVPRRTPRTGGEVIRYQSPSNGYNNSAWNNYQAPQSQQYWGATNTPAQSSTSGGYLPRGAQPASPGTAGSTYSQPYTQYPNNSYPAPTVPTRNAAFQNGAPVGGDPFANTAPPPTVYGAPPANVQPGFAQGAPVQGYQQPVYQSAPPPAAGVLPTPGAQGSYVSQPYLSAPPMGSPPYNGSPPVTDPNGVIYTLPEPAVDITATAAETQTGRLMLGVGVNSDAGLVGNFVLDEQNFDIMRLPRSWEDISNGSAWRGAGQRFRLEANPGTVVQRYAVSFQEPYLFNTQNSLGVSGFYFTRIYQDWSEGRVGGNVKLGRMLRPDLSVRVGFDGQRVDVYNPRVPTPDILEEAVGQNDRYGFSVGGSHDTRDSPFLPTEGHLVSADFEQVVGSFIYPRFILEGRQYFQLRQRADGSGRHVIGIGGVFGVTGENTPIYDNFFAGGFSSLRGFAFRGASPTVDGVQVGGRLEALGTVEYMFPITADDALRGVVFCDFGTVNQSIAFDSDQFRAAPGFGLRISIPAMGPAPIALDLAFPVASAVGDQEQIFSFFVGLAR